MPCLRKHLNKLNGEDNLHTYVDIVDNEDSYIVDIVGNLLFSVLHFNNTMYLYVYYKT